MSKALVVQNSNIPAISSRTAYEHGPAGKYVPIEADRLPKTPTGQTVPRRGVHLVYHELLTNDFIEPPLEASCHNGVLWLGKDHVFPSTYQVRDTSTMNGCLAIMFGDDRPTYLNQLALETVQAHSFVPDWFLEYDYVLFPGTIWRSVPPPNTHFTDPRYSEYWAPAWQRETRGMVLYPFFGNIPRPSGKFTMAAFRPTRPDWWTPYGIADFSAEHPVWVPPYIRKTLLKKRMYQYPPRIQRFLGIRWKLGGVKFDKYNLAPPGFEPPI